jgi:hypothetical protein
MKRINIRIYEGEVEAEMQIKRREMYSMKSW